MARPIAEDKFHNYAYQIKTLGDIKTSGGFTAGAALPELTIDMVEYRAGDGPTFKEKYPGLVTVGTNLVLSRGVVLRNSELGQWAIKWAKGEPYRTEIELTHYHGQANACRKFKLHNAFPIRWKTGTDLDAQSSDINIEELEIAYEWFDIEEGTDDMPVRLTPNIPV